MCLQASRPCECEGDTRCSTKHLVVLHHFQTLSSHQQPDRSGNRISTRRPPTDLLIKLNEWIEPDGTVESAWMELSPNGREKASAQFCDNLSDLLDIFQRWQSTHPRNDLAYMMQTLQHTNGGQSLLPTQQGVPVNENENPSN